MGLYIFYTLLILFFAILQIIVIVKFFQIARHIADIHTEVMQKRNEQTYTHHSVDDSMLGKTVVDIRTEKQMKVHYINNDGTYQCTHGGMLIGTFAPSEVIEFEKYVKNLKDN